MTDATGRDRHGRFTAGNPGGPGGARRKAFELRRAAEDAVSPEHVQAIIRRATRMALEGNIAAMRLVLERTAGRAPEVPPEPEPIAIDLPRLRTATDCTRAIETIIAALCDGGVSQDVAKILIDAVQARLRSIEVVEIEERLEQLERSASVVEQNDKRTR